MEGPPPQYTAKTLDDYLEHLSKGVFQAGISWRVVDAKWPSIKKAFHRFNVERVARMKDRDIDALATDERVIRSRPKIAAVVHNANELLVLERAGGFKKHLRSFPEYEALATDLKKRFKFVGDSGVYHFLWTVKQPVPDWHEWSRAHGMNWDAKAKASGSGGSRTSRGKTRVRPKARSQVRVAR
jgi:3-methyladenine DNA glycosylase Tag